MTMKFFIDNDKNRAISNTSAPVIAVILNDDGYWPIQTMATASQLNPTDMTAEVLDAALAGSMFGWNVPAARAAVEYANNHRKGA